jgi:hypothetical protein
MEAVIGQRHRSSATNLIFFCCRDLKVSDKREDYAELSCVLFQDHTTSGSRNKPSHHPGCRCRSAPYNFLQKHRLPERHSVQQHQLLYSLLIEPEALMTDVLIASEEDYSSDHSWPFEKDCVPQDNFDILLLFCRNFINRSAIFISIVIHAVTSQTVPCKAAYEIIS